MSDSTTNATKLLISVSVGVAVTLISGGFYLWRNYKKLQQSNKIPEKWSRVGKLKFINLFPVKSCAPLKISPGIKVECGPYGLVLSGFRDRTMMIVDENYKMITARVYPKMVLIQPTIVETNKLVFTAPNMEKLEIILDLLKEYKDHKELTTHVWGAKVRAFLCGDKYDKWFSNFILGRDSGLHLIYHKFEKPSRFLNPRVIKEPKVQKFDSGTFHDATSYMLINLASIEDLQKRISDPIHALQFRGNFYIEMDKDEAFAEDEWKWVKIGDVIFKNILPCTRCIFPNINPLTAERNPQCEPLKTLKSYRKWEKYPSPVMGIHIGIREGEGHEVQMDDIIYISDE